MSEKYLIEQEKEVLDYFIDQGLIPYCGSGREILQDYDFKTTEQAINLIIRPECNQQCEYCYIYQHGNELYPTRLNKEETLHNVELVMKYILEQKKIFPKVWELFAGDLFYDDIFFDIMDLFDKYYQRFYDRYPELFDPTIFPDLNLKTDIIVPSNLSFVYYHPEKVEKLRYYKKYLWEKYKMRIAFSWSSDGIFATDSREKKVLDQEYFDIILRFCMEFECGAHPMISPENVKNWKENYDWWINMINKLNVATDYDADFQPYLLEVRNANWTDENIKDYCSFLDHLMEIRFKKCGNDAETLAYHLLDSNNTEKNPLIINHYDPLRLLYSEPIQDQNDRIGCGMGTGLHFNCTNLSLVICHRLTYQHLTACYYKTNEENTEIVDFEPQNVSAYIAARTLKQYALPICGSCIFSEICLKGCLGANFEYSGEFLLPIPSVCKFFFKKYTHLIKLYEKYGIFDAVEKNEDIAKFARNSKIQYLLNLREYVKRIEEEEEEKNE